MPGSHITMSVNASPLEWKCLFWALPTEVASASVRRCLPGRSQSSSRGLIFDWWPLLDLFWLLKGWNASTWVSSYSWVTPPLAQSECKSWFSMVFRTKASVCCHVNAFAMGSEWKSLIHIWLFTIPQTAACQASLSMEFSGPEYWSG